MENHYFDADGIYLGSASAHEASFPPENALRVQPPREEGFWPVLNETRDGWISVEDHRGRRGWLNGREITITGLGTLPAGWDDGPDESIRENLPGEEDARFYLTARGTYHTADCRFTSAVGEWLTREAVLERTPAAKACGRCRPEPLHTHPQKEDA